MKLKKVFFTSRILICKYLTPVLRLENAKVKEEELLNTLMSHFDRHFQENIAGGCFESKEYQRKRILFLLQLIIITNNVTPTEFEQAIESVQDTLDLEAALKMSMECHEDYGNSF